MIKLLGSQLINQYSFIYCVFFIVEEAAQMISDDSLIDIRGEMKSIHIKVMIIYNLKFHHK